MTEHIKKLVDFWGNEMDKLHKQCANCINKETCKDYGLIPQCEQYKEQANAKSNNA